MASICLKAISILAGNLNSGRSYLITTVQIACRLIFKIFIDLCVFFGSFYCLVLKHCDQDFKGCVHILGDWREHTYTALKIAGDPCN